MRNPALKTGKKAMDDTIPLLTEHVFARSCIMSYF